MRLRWVLYWYEVYQACHSGAMLLFLKDSQTKKPLFLLYHPAFQEQGPDGSTECCRTGNGDGCPYCGRRRVQSAFWRGQKTGTERNFRPVADYSMPNVSDKVVRIILSYTDYIKRVVWNE